uniref:F-box domain-containing protein n=1 Tax=Oryza barthii TaxID=65489 RepID=A0A0D3GCN3_9ORYZ
MPSTTTAGVDVDASDASLAMSWACAASLVAIAGERSPETDRTTISMGMLNLMRLMSVKRRRRRQVQVPHDGLIALRAKRKGSPCQQDGDSQGAADIEIPDLPEDIWRLIHSLMPMRAAARAACVSRSFLSSWRCHPNLNFSSEAFGLNRNACGKEELAGLFYSKVNHILKRHSGIGVKKLTIKVYSDCSGKGSSYLNNWLQIAVKPGIEELIISLTQFQAKYNFPCFLLSNGSGDSIQYLHLSNCSFHPTVTLGGLRSLTRLYLCCVRITENELGCLLSHSLALEQLEIRYCDRIVCLKVPCLLQRLISLKVFGCDDLKLIENEAPNVSIFAFQGDKTQLKLGETLQIKSLCMVRSGYVYHARAELPSIMPNLESLAIKSRKETAFASKLCSKFLCLKHLSIALIGYFPAYDYLSLASYIHAAPSLETFYLNRYVQNVSIFAHPADLRSIREEQHHSLKSVRVTSFISVKSLVELTCHILESTTSLECLTLDASQTGFRCDTPGSKIGKCPPLERDIIMEGHRGVLAIRRCIQPRVPSTVKLNVLEPCSCHSTEL